jgi:hypothetical protein
MKVCVRENGLSRFLSWPLLVICYILMLNSTSTKDYAFSYVICTYTSMPSRLPSCIDANEINLTRYFQALETSDASYSNPQLTTQSQVLCHFVTPIWYRTRNCSATLSVGHRTLSVHHQQGALDRIYLTIEFTAPNSSKPLQSSSPAIARMAPIYPDVIG